MNYIKNIVLVGFFILISQAIHAQTDRSKAPTPTTAPKIQISKANTFALANGLRVIVVENHKVPRVSVQISIDATPNLENEKAGLSAIAGALMGRGTATRTKDQIDEMTDFVGADLNTSATGLYISCLTKHLPQMLELGADVLLNPSFEQAELDKIIKQKLSELELEADNPDAIARNLEKSLLYTKNHPYGEITTEKTVKNITATDCKNYYKATFLPNIAYMVVVGDITPALARTLANSYFGKWQQGAYTPPTYPTPPAIATPAVAFVPKAGAVQSVVNIAHTTDLKPGTTDALTMEVVNNILGASGYSRLFMNLREDKAYTYGAYSNYNADKIVGSFGAEASVRTEVTDSAITQFMYELNKIRTEAVKPEELQQVKNILTGNFARALENPQTIAKFALNTAKYKLPADYYENYLANVQALTPAQVLEIAQKYITPKNAHIMVVGDKKIADKLSQFGALNYYDAQGNAAKPQAELPKELTAQKVIDNYLTAVGGAANIKKIKSLNVKMTAEIQGEKLAITRLYKAPNLFKEELKVKIMTLQSRTYNGSEGFEKSMGSPDAAPTGEDLDELKFDAYIIPELYINEMGAKMELIGSETINDQLAYILQTKFAGGKIHTDYFDAKTGLKLRSTQASPNPDGNTTTAATDYLDYKAIQNVLIPHTIAQNVGGMKIKATIVTIKANEKMKDSAFAIKK